MEFSGWETLWIAWIAVFCVIEGIALMRRQPGDTLTEQVRNWLKTGPDQVPTPLAWVLRVGVLLLLIWLIPHFLFPGLGF